LKASQNNIGTLAVVTGAGAQLALTFPANFSGPVRVMCYVTGTGVTAVPGVNITALAQIVNVYDLYNAAGSAVSNIAPEGGTSGIGVTDLYVRASNNGSNNQITLGTATATTITSIDLWLYSYNCGSSPGNPVTQASARVQWVNSLGVATVPS